MRVLTAGPRRNVPSLPVAFETKAIARAVYGVGVRGNGRIGIGDCTPNGYERDCKTTGLPVAPVAFELQARLLVDCALLELNDQG